MWRLFRARHFWRDTLAAPPSVLHVIEEGYKLPFVSRPEPFRAFNGSSANHYHEFVSSEIERLVKDGVVAPVSRRPPGVCALGVDDSRDKLRLIANEIPLNVFLNAPKFRFESVNTARDTLFPDDSLVQFDFKSAYHHMRMWLHHVGWLGFWWRGQYYVFLALPFGLCSAPYAFTKLARVIVRYFRSKGVRLTLMLDDGLVALAPGQLHLVPWIRQVLRQSGFLVAEEKSSWIPSPATPSFLGYTLDVRHGRLGITAKRLGKVRLALTSTDITRPVLRRSLASLVGRIVSMSLVFGSLVRMMTRSLYQLMGGEGHFRWEETVEWSSEALEEFQFWAEFDRIGRFARTVPLWAEHLLPDLVVWSDASDTGIGAVCEDTRLALPLPLHARGTSSSYRELQAVLIALQVFGDRLRNRRVEWRLDSQVAVLVLVSGSRSDDCHVVARAVCDLATSLEVVIVPIWVPREQNTVADDLSNFIDWGDYTLLPAVFSRVCELFGVVPDVDLFAALDNNRCVKFFSRFSCPGSSGANAFLHPWSGFRCLYAFPPIPLLSLLLRRLVESTDSHFQVVLILPVWPSQPWWPLLCPDGTHSRPEVTAWRRLRRSDFKEGPSGPPSFLSRRSWKFSFVALLWEPISVPTGRPASFCTELFQGRGCQPDCQCRS